MTVRRALAGVVALVVACTLARSASAAFRLVGVARGFDQPVQVASTPSERARLYVVEQAGVIKVIERGRVRATPFLDIRDLVRSGGEQGLLSLAFHPSYATNRRLYVNYTNRSGDTRVVEYRANRARTRAVESSRRILLAVDQPFANHNGGQLAFGRDGYLYVGMGDGGGGGDPGNRAQRIGSRLGKLLRLNVNARSPSAEIVALGLRNPWRFSLDRPTGRLYIADVGQNAWEEVDVFRPSAAGLENYGWSVYEGAHIYDGSRSLYGPSRLVRPIHEYGHANGRCSITGGFVYRGSIPAARRRYFFGDYCTGEVWSFSVRTGGKSDLRIHPRLRVPGFLSSFGLGPGGGLYLVSHIGGRVYRLGAA